MKKYFLQSGLALMLALGLSAISFAQQSPDKLGEYDEIIIKKKGTKGDKGEKGDKDTKVVVEIKDGVVLVNGKPVSEFEDENVSVRKKKVVVSNGNEIIVNGYRTQNDFRTKTPPASPYRSGTFIFDEKDMMAMDMNGNKAMLGVVTDKDGAGVKITDVSEESAAAKAGLQKGDIITKVFENNITSPAKLAEVIGKFKPEDKVIVTYIRDGKTKTTTATLSKREINLAMTLSGDINMQMAELQALKGQQLKMDRRLFAPEDRNYNYNFNYSMDARPKLGIRAQETEDGKGLKVTGVDAASNAANAGIKEGDIITSFDGKPVNSTETLIEAAHAAKEKSTFQIGLLRNGKSENVEVKIPKKLKTANL
jgi:serine protease Do